MFYHWLVIRPLRTVGSDRRTQATSSRGPPELYGFSIEMEQAIQEGERGTC